MYDYSTGKVCKYDLYHFAYIFLHLRKSIATQALISNESFEVRKLRDIILQYTPSARKRFWYVCAACKSSDTCLAADHALSCSTRSSQLACAHARMAPECGCRISSQDHLAEVSGSSSAWLSAQSSKQHLHKSAWRGMPVNQTLATASLPSSTNTTVVESTIAEASMVD